MKGGYNNGTNSSASAAAASVLGLTTALSQARLNGSHTGGNYSKATDFEKGYSEAKGNGNSSSVANNWQSIPKTKKADIRNKDAAKSYAATRVKRGNPAANLTSAAKADKSIGLSGNLSGNSSSYLASKPNNEARKKEAAKSKQTEEYRYDEEPSCLGIRHDKRASSYVASKTYQSPNNPNRTMVKFQGKSEFVNEEGYMFHEVIGEDGKMQCIDLSKSQFRVAAKMCPPRDNRNQTVYIHPKEDAWKLDDSSMQKLLNRLNEEIGKPFNVEFKNGTKSEYRVFEGSHMFIGFYNSVEQDTGARLHVMTPVHARIAAPEYIDQKYSEYYCEHNSEKTMELGW